MDAMHCDGGHMGCSWADFAFSLKLHSNVFRDTMLVLGMVQILLPKKFIRSGIFVLRNLLRIAIKKTLYSWYSTRGHSKS